MRLSDIPYKYKPYLIGKIVKYFQSRCIILDIVSIRVDVYYTSNQFRIDDCPVEFFDIASKAVIFSLKTII